jgi:hypothetical protein
MEHIMEAVQEFKKYQFGGESLVLFIIGIIPLLQTIHYLGDAPGMAYGYSHLFITYDQGFSKRALYGTAFSFMNFISKDAAKLIGFAAVALVVIMIYWLFRREIFHSTQRSILFSFLLSGSGVLPHLSFISGFLDVPMFALLTMSLILLRRSTSFISIISVGLLSVFGILMHEAYFLMFYPLLLAIYITDTRLNRDAFIWPAVSTMIVVAAFILTIKYGNLKVDPQVYFDIARLRTDIKLNKDAFFVNNNSFGNQLSYLVNQYDIKSISGISLTLLTSLPYLFALYTILLMLLKIISKIPNLKTEYGSYILTSILSAPILLTFIGHDVMRWVSAACINISLFVAYHIARGEDDGKEFAASFCGDLASRNWFYACFIFSIVIGPFGAIAGNRIVGKFALLFGIYPV